MAKKIKAAVIGCGRIGAEFDNDPKRKYISTHTGAYSAVKGVDLVAVCDVDPSKASKCAEHWQVPAVDPMPGADRLSFVERVLSQVAVVGIGLLVLLLGLWAGLA